jgi:hypothetical protein
VARQPAIYVDVPLKVTGDAFIHVPGFVRQPVQVLNQTVALLARYVVVNVPLMVEQDVLGHVIDFYPGGRFLPVEIFVLLLNPRMPFNDVIMAVQALFHGRHSRKIGVGHVGVAILALNLFNPAVDVVTERNRLLGSQSGVRHCIEQDHKRTDEDGAGQRSE